jgi:hypothetical protein
MSADDSAITDRKSYFKGVCGTNAGEKENLRLKPEIFRHLKEKI